MSSKLVFHILTPLGPEVPPSQPDVFVPLVPTLARPSISVAGASSATPAPRSIGGVHAIAGGDRIPPSNLHLDSFPSQSFWDWYKTRNICCPAEVPGIPIPYDYMSIILTLVSSSSFHPVNSAISFI